MAINLLPPIQKQEIAAEKTRRKVALILCLVLLDILLFLVIMFCLNFYLASQVKSFTDFANAKEQLLKSPEFQISKSSIEIANQNLLQVSSTRKEQVSCSVVLEKLSFLLPSDIYLTSFSFQNSFIEEGEENKERIFLGKIRIGGVAKSREALLLFKKALSQEASFKDLYFDPSSWVSPTNANFSATFNYFK
ncbi:MAG: hypothetical protein PHE77_02620 [Candidatus Pacebacteria bacterium]|nr:hypothetical protein [Candidatus Paceibacterota bacterium]